MSKQTVLKIFCKFRIFYFLSFGFFFYLRPSNCFVCFCYCFTCFLFVFFTNSNNYSLSLGSVFLLVHIDIDKDADCLQSNNNVSLNYLWLLFATLVFFRKVWFNSRNNIKLRLLVILIVPVLLFLHKHIKIPDHHEAIRSCSKHEFFTVDYIDTCENIQSLGTPKSFFKFKA